MSSTWTENIRSYILAGSSAWRESEVSEIDCSIETKLDEFSKLATAGQMLVQEESRFKNIVSVWWFTYSCHNASNVCCWNMWVHMWPCDAHYMFSWLQSSCIQIKERTDELQSMLGWIQVNWRAQREQFEGDQNVKREETVDAVQQEVTAWLAL